MKKQLEKEFNEFIESLNNQEKIVCDEKIFFKKLNISPDTAKFLKGVENLKGFLEVGAGAFAGGSGALWIWWSSASTITKLALTMGFASLPLNIIGIGAVVGGIGILTIKTLVKKLRKSFVDEVPKFIKAPIDILAFNVLNILVFLSLKIAYEDGKLDSKELNTITRNLVYKWGFCEDFIEKYISNLLKFEVIKEIPYEDFAKLIKEVKNIDKNIDINILKNALLEEIKDVILADGILHPNEWNALYKLEKILEKI